MKQLLFLGGCALLSIGCPRQPYSIRLVDASNDPLPTIEVKGNDVALGETGKTYRIEIENRTKKEVGFVVSVDGLDTHSGRTVPLEERGGYRVPSNSWGTIDGFELSRTQISTFRFVDGKDAFAKRQGQSTGIGRIEARVFALRCGSSTNIPFQYTRPPPAESSTPGNSSTNDPEPFAGELLTVEDKGTALCILDLGAELARIVLAYRKPNGERLGTAGPPPIPSAPAISPPVQNPIPKSPLKKTIPTVIDKKKG